MSDTKHSGWLLLQLTRNQCHVTTIQPIGLSLVSPYVNARFAINYELLVGPAKMGEHNLVNPGFVGQLVNIHTRDACYLSNFRASDEPLGIQTSRRHNVFSLSWNPSEPCTGYPQSYVSLNSTYTQSCDIPRQEEHRCCYSESACATSGAGDNNNTSLKLDNSSVSGLKNLNGIDNGENYSKYDYLTTAEHLTLNPPSCRSLESDSGSSLVMEGSKTPPGITSPLTSPNIHTAIHGGESL